MSAFNSKASGRIHTTYSIQLHRPEEGKYKHSIRTFGDMSLYTNSLEVSLLLFFMFLHQMTPFHIAAERGRCANILGYLIDNGDVTSINIKDKDGVSTIHR